MGRDYASELRPPMGLLSIPQVIYEHEETRWNDIEKGKLIRPPDLTSILPTQSSISKQEKREREIMNLALRSIYVHTSKVFFTCCKILRHGPPDLLPLRRKACCGFLSHLGPTTSTVIITQPRQLNFIVNTTTNNLR
jgi:hypothetical protein